MQDKGRSLDLKLYLTKSIELVKLKGATAIEVSKDERALLPGIGILAIGGAAVAVGALFEGVVAKPAEVMFLLFFGPVLNVLMFSLFIAFFHGIAKLFGGKATFPEYYRTAALASIITWVQVVPAFGTVLSLWSLPVNVMILESVHKLKRLEAVAVIALMMSSVLGLLYFTGMLG